MFAYCGNNPVSRIDANGEAFETVWDILSLCSSVADVITNPYDLWAWGSFAGDLVDVLIPGVGGLGEAVKVIRGLDKVSDGFGALSKAAKYGIETYNNLKKTLKGTGLQAHHIIEQRLVKHLGININQMLSVAVTAAEHQKFTNHWRKLFKYGTDYSKLTKLDLWKAAQEVYENYPALLKAAKEIIFG